MRGFRAPPPQLLKVTILLLLLRGRLLVRGASERPGQPPPLRPGPLASSDRRVTDPRPAAGSTTSCRLLFGPALSHVPPWQDKRSRVNFSLPPSAKPVWCGDPVEPRSRTEQPRQRSRMPRSSADPIQTFIPRRHGCLGKRFRPTVQGREAVSRSLRCRAAQQAPLPTRGQDRAGQGAPGRRSPPSPVPSWHRCPYLAAKSCGNRLGSPKGGGEEG